MAEETGNSKFEKEVLELLGRLVTRTSENSSDLKALREEVSTISADVKSLSGQFNDVGVMAIKDNKRIDDLESRISDLEAGIH